MSCGQAASTRSWTSVAGSGSRSAGGGRGWSRAARGWLPSQVPNSSPAEKRCSWSGFFLVRSTGRLIGVALPNPPFVTDGRLEVGAARGDGGPLRE